jgi:hypothetical protein
MLGVHIFKGTSSRPRVKFLKHIFKMTTWERKNIFANDVGKGER